MDEQARIRRAIRLNAAIAAVAFSGVALAIVLVLAGVLDWDARMAMSLGGWLVLGVLGLATAWLIRRDRDDPAGAERRERRFVDATVAWGGLLLLLGLFSVVGIIAWGLLR